MVTISCTSYMPISLPDAPANTTPKPTCAPVHLPLSINTSAMAQIGLAPGIAPVPLLPINTFSMPPFGLPAGITPAPFSDLSINTLAMPQLELSIPPLKLFNPSFEPPKFGSLTAKTSSTGDNGTYTYDETTVNNLVSKYNNALKHVGDKQAFVRKVVGIANKYNVDPNAMLVMMYSEGGLNPKSSGGLFGLISATAKNYGIDMNAFRNKSAIAQLDDYERILADQIKMSVGNSSTKISAPILYAMNFTPAYVKDAIKDENHILVSANSSSAKKREFFRANCGKGSLADGKDYISFDTLQTRLDRKEREMIALG